LGPILASAAALGRFGTAAEAGLLHSRGAFQNPFMYLPVTVPLLAGAAVGAALLDPSDARVRIARALLWSTAGLARSAWKPSVIAASPSRTVRTMP